jgi:hypothetical protein
MFIYIYIYNIFIKTLILLGFDSCATENVDLRVAQEKIGEPHGASCGLKQWTFHLARSNQWVSSGDDTFLVVSHSLSGRL